MIGGVDVLGTAPGGIPYAVQCKLYTRPVGPGQVRDFIGALRAAAYKGHRGVLVTSSVLSKQAHQTASEDGMIVIDRDRLADWMMGAYSVHAGAGASPAWLVRLRRGRAGRKRSDPRLSFGRTALIRGLRGRTAPTRGLRGRMAPTCGRMVPI